MVSAARACTLAEEGAGSIERGTSWVGSSLIQMYLHLHTSVGYTIHVLAMYSAQTSPVPVYVLSPFCVPQRCEDVRRTLHSRVESSARVCLYVVLMLASLAIQAERLSTRYIQYLWQGREPSNAT